MRKGTLRLLTGALLAGAIAGPVLMASSKRLRTERHARADALVRAELELIEAADEALNTVCGEILRAGREGLDGAPMAPLCTSALAVRSKAGVSEFRLQVEDGRLDLIWRRDGHRLVLASDVEETFCGEAAANFSDDNDNGFMDEPGFFVALDARSATVGLSLSQPHGSQAIRAYRLRTLALPR